MKNQFILAIATLFFLDSCGKKTQETKPIRRDVIETVFALGVLEAKILIHSKPKQTDICRQ